MRYAILLIPNLGKEIVDAEYAVHDQIYLCPECENRVYLRKSDHQSSAFCHYTRTGNCSRESSNSGNGDYYPNLRSVNQFFDYIWRGQSQKRLAAAIINMFSYSYLGYLNTLDTGKRNSNLVINKGYDATLDKTQAIINGAKLFGFKDVCIIFQACLSIINSQHSYRFLRNRLIKKKSKNHSKIIQSLQTNYHGSDLDDLILINDYIVHHKAARKVLFKIILNFDKSEMEIFVFIVFVYLFSVEILESENGSLVSFEYCQDPNGYKFENLGCFDLKILERLVNDPDFLSQTFKLLFEKPDSPLESVVFVDLILSDLAELILKIDWSILPHFYVEYVEISNTYHLKRNFERLSNIMQNIFEYQYPLVH